MDRNHCCLLGVGFFAREQLKILLWRDGVFVAESVRFVIVQYHQHNTVGSDARTQSDVLIVRFGVPYALIRHLSEVDLRAHTRTPWACITSAHLWTVLVNRPQHLCSSDRVAAIARNCHDSRCHHIR